MKMAKKGKKLSARDRIKAQRKDLEKSADKSHKSRDSFPSFETIFNEDAFPEWLKRWFPSTKDTNIIDILPFIGTKNTPNIDEGDMGHVIDVWVHTRIGAMDLPFVCPEKNFGKKCPICQYIKKGGLDKEEYAALRAKRRCIYLIWPEIEGKDRDEIRVHIYEEAHFFMEKYLAEISKNPRGGGYRIFSDPDTEEGASIAFKKTKKGKNKVEYSGHQLIDREDPIPDDILEDALDNIDLDEIIKWHPTYDEIKKAFYDEDDDDGSKKSTEEDPDEDEESEDVEETYEEEEVEEEEEEAEEEAEDEGDYLDEMDRDELKAHIKKNGYKKKFGMKVLKKDSDDDLRDKIREVENGTDEEEGEEEEKQSTSSSGKNKCPYGHKFGEDISNPDTQEDCEECELWDECDQAAGE
jgi:DNA segregation ATPase FtsK/SpoIIIE-like protein